MLTMVFGESPMNRTQVEQLWYYRLKEDRENVLGIRRITIREIADDVGIWCSSRQLIFTDVLGMKRATAKIVQILLNFEQKQRRMDTVQEQLMKFNYDPDLLRQNITDYESWVYGYDIETKAQSAQ